MGKISLADFAGPIAASLPQNPCRCRIEKNHADHHTFSSQNLPEPPPLLSTAGLVVTDTEHHYGNCCRIDAVHFYASGRVHRQLGVLILSALFSKSTKSITIDLEHEASSIRRLEVNGRGYSHVSSSGYRREPVEFTYHPEIPQNVPWNWHLDERDLPAFDLDFREAGHPIRDLRNRDKAKIDGSDDALVLLAELLLNIGLPACDAKPDEGSLSADKTYVLECSLGNQRVAKWSAEAQFHLPHSHSWPGEYPSLDL
jgi:hypothetical protein